MREDTVVFILSHRRADSVRTYGSIRKAGYSGAVRVIVDDTDPELARYLELYGSEVLVFSKDDMAGTFDLGDNFQGTGTVTFARNVCHRVAQDLGFDFFVVLDDDYYTFQYKYRSDGTWRRPSPSIRHTLDESVDAMVRFVSSTPVSALCASQAGDHIGGQHQTVAAKRKAMNWWVCATARPFTVVGRMNDDVNTYVLGAMRGDLYLTTMQLMLSQYQTQINSGGLTEMYLNAGTYVKSFYTVMMAPACCSIAMFGDPHNKTGDVRIHHKINWKATAPKIVRESTRKAGASAKKKLTGKKAVLEEARG